MYNRHIRLEVTRKEVNEMHAVRKAMDYVETHLNGLYGGVTVTMNGVEEGKEIVIYTYLPEKNRFLMGSFRYSTYTLLDTVQHIYEDLQMLNCYDIITVKYQNCTITLTNNSGKFDTKIEEIARIENK